jgi:hypothetical protein
MTRHATTIDRATRTSWYPWSVCPVRCGWYEIRAVMCDNGMRMFWSGSEWGFWGIGADGYQQWVRWHHVATDNWRGLARPA